MTLLLSVAAAGGLYAYPDTAATLRSGLATQLRSWTSPPALSNLIKTIASACAKPGASPDAVETTADGGAAQVDNTAPTPAHDDETAIDTNEDATTTGALQHDLDQDVPASTQQTLPSPTGYEAPPHHDDDAAEPAACDPRQASAPPDGAHVSNATAPPATHLDVSSEALVPGPPAVAEPGHVGRHSAGAPAYSGSCASEQDAMPQPSTAPPVQLLTGAEAGSPAAMAAALTPEVNPSSVSRLC